MDVRRPAPPGTNGGVEAPQPAAVPAPTWVARIGNFDSLRFWAAIAVLWSHTFPISYGAGYPQPLYRVSGGQTTLGTVALATFFVISGYLVTRSFERSRTAWRYVKARALRIMPGVIVCVVVIAFVMGPLLTTLPLGAYLASWDPWRYVLKNGSLLGFHDFLAGVFEDNPRAHVNGSLWTLQIEVICYLMVLGLGLVGLLNRWVTLALYGAGIAYLVWHGHNDMSEFAQQAKRVDLLTKFLAGAVLYHWQVPLDGRIALASAVGAIACLLAGGFWLALHTLVPYLLIYVALAPWLRLPNMARYGDLSYGTYLYAWPLTQVAVLLLLPEPEWYTAGLIATAFTLTAAFLSWHLVEKVALSFKDRPLPLEAPFDAWAQRRFAPIRDALRGLHSR